MHRRRLLAVSAAGLLGTAGCTADGDAGTTPTDSTPTGTPRETDTPTPTPTGPQPSVTVERTRVLPSLVALNTPDSADVVGEPGERYALVTVDAGDADAPPAREDFSLSVDGTSHDPTVDIGYGQGLNYFHALGASIYGVEGPSGDLPFVLTPTETRPEVRLSWPDGETALEGVGEALARPSTTAEVESFTAEITDRGSVGLSVTVHNTGDARGWLVGAMNRRGPSVAVAPVTGMAVEVPPGETRGWSYADDDPTDDQGTAEYTLRTASENYETSIEVGGD